MTLRVVAQWQCAGLTLLLLLKVASGQAQTRQVLTPEACTEIRYLAPDDVTSLPPLQLSPDGSRIAYVLQVPDLASNTNKDELFIRSMDAQSTSAPDLELTNELIAAVRWFSDNRTLAALVHHDGKTTLVRVDSQSKDEMVIWEAASDITDYSMDAAGDTIAVAVRVKSDTPPSSESQGDSERGYRLDIASTAHAGRPRREIYVLKQNDNHEWAAVKRITFISPLSKKPLRDIVDNHDLRISLSPDGRYLSMDNVENFSDVPQEGVWGTSPLVQYMKRTGFEGVLVNYLYDLTSDVVSMPLNSPIVREGVWAPDSKSYIKIALAPAGSKWEASDLAKGSPNDHITHMFAVDVRTGDISEVLERAERAPLAWTSSGDVIERDASGNLVSLREQRGRWNRTSEIHPPVQDASSYSPMVSDGHSAVMEYENAHIAPELIGFDLSKPEPWTIAQFNPQVANFILPRSETVTWTTSTGFTAKGLLLLPPDYDPKEHYPLVIESGSVLYSGEFVCDAGATHVSSFARGILADSGVAYLMRYWPGINDWETNYYPKGYPGAIAEAAFKLDLAESAVKELSERGIIDPARVGLIGFSRGGWYVEYALTHSHIPFRAATVTDNAQYSMGEYWYLHNENRFRDLEGMYGGPPYGKSLQNWLDYSISFTLDKVHTPLLMEVMGYGKSDEPNRPPDNLAVHDEVFVGLSRLNKPVELYYYPNEQHQPEHPLARIASLQRNVDWYRFWLQGVERPHPEDVNQYHRWRLMALQDIDSPGH